jgi:hypothetical protein
MLKSLKVTRAMLDLLRARRISHRWMGGERWVVGEAVSRSGRPFANRAAEG